LTDRHNRSTNTLSRHGQQLVLPLHDLIGMHVVFFIVFGVEALP
jgi:hypothetical protein